VKGLDRRVDQDTRQIPLIPPLPVQTKEIIEKFLQVAASHGFDLYVFNTFKKPSGTPQAATMIGNQSGKV
jgi:hypothetical protein